MTRKETMEAIEELKKQGYTEDDMLLTFYAMFQEDKITLEQLGSLVELIGYELSEEFLNMSEKDQKTKGYENIEDYNDVELDELAKKLYKHSKVDKAKAIYINHNELGALRKIVDKKGISLSDMAETLNITKTTLYAIILWEKELTYNMYKKI